MTRARMAAPRTALLLAPRSALLAAPPTALLGAPRTALLAAPRTALLATALLAAALLAGCGGGGPAPELPPGARLAPSPATLTNLCDRAAQRADVPVRCPKRLPAHRGRGVAKVQAFGKTSGAYLLDIENGFAGGEPHAFHLLVGGQREPFGRNWDGIDEQLRVTTRKVTIPMRGGGRFTQQLPARQIGTARVRGNDAVVLREPPYPQGGLHGGHVVVLWNEGGHGYLVSVHGERLSQRALTSLATRIAASS